jgi:hypothetical protein
MNLAPFQFASVLYFLFWSNRQAANTAAILPHPYHEHSALLFIRSVVTETSCRIPVMHLNAISSGNPLTIYWSAGSGSPAAKAVHGWNVGDEGCSERLYTPPGYA